MFTLPGGKKYIHIIIQGIHIIVQGIHIIIQACKQKLIHQKKNTQIINDPENENQPEVTKVKGDTTSGIFPGELMVSEPVTLLPVQE